MTGHDMQIRRLAVAVLVTVGLFPAVVVALNLVQQPDGYRVARDAVSDLALGRGGALMTVAFCSLGFGTLLFAALLHRTSSRAVVRTTLLSLAGVLSFVSAVFHTDPTGAPSTVHGNIHNLAGVLTFVAMLLVMATSASRFRRDANWRGLALPTAGFTVVGVVSFFLVPVLGPAYFGVCQRLLIGSFLIWIMVAATSQLRTSSRRPLSTADTTAVRAA